MVVPAYNSEHTIKECLQAVRNSVYKDYELIVVDCNSTDGTAAAAGQYADRVIKLTGGGRIAARQAGINAAKGRIVVNIDSDVLVQPDTFSGLSAYFEGHHDVDVVTGLLSKECRDSGFFSRYKNLYMNYIFRRLPERVTFIYGSIYAARKEALVASDPLVKIADDTALGQQLVSSGRQIAFLRGMEVVHLKKYNIFSFLKNDFRIPFDWAHIFIRYKGWKELFGKRSGYAHSPNGQLASVILAQLVIFTAAFMPLVTAGIFFIWFVLNLDFIIFLGREKGIGFAARAYVVTFFDHLVMGIGIICGFFSYFLFKGGSRA